MHHNCRYCGFSRDNPILRVSLTVDEVLREARALQEQGFRNLLLVAGEHPRFVSNGYLHTAGPKRNFDWRLETPERAYAAGFRRLGIVELGASEWAPAQQPPPAPTEQFHIADHRSPAEVARQIRALGYEPVWKDWDAALTA